MLIGSLKINGWLSDHYVIDIQAATSALEGYLFIDLQLDILKIFPS